MLVERREDVTPRIGESLVPAARRLLADMGLLESFLTEGHEPWYGNRSLWGSSEIQEFDFLRDPDGYGWHLDRARFEQWLRDAARGRGAELLCPATIDKLEYDDRRWHVLLKTATGPLHITSDLIIDAGGRAAPIARKLGARTQIEDRLICAWVYGHDEYNSCRGLTYVEAVEDGWWYTAPIPAGQRVLAFHTDADLPSARFVRERNGLLQHAGASQELSALLTDVGFVPGEQSGVTAAHSARLEPFVDKNWLAVGDAVISFDPLSSQGLYNALFTGLAGAEAADRYLRGDTLSLSEYSQTLRGIVDAYSRHLAFYYSTETRWTNASFWQRRHPSA
jgi:flavin-dependent dehydrogenase